MLLFEKMLMAGKKVRVGKSLYMWGRGFEGRLGLGDKVSRSSPVQVGALTNWSYLAIGAFHTLSIQKDGTLWSWGDNRFGQLGYDNTIYRSSPVQVGASTDWSIVSAGYYYTMAIRDNGTLWAWGGQFFGNGEMGLNDNVRRSSPTQVGSLGNWSDVCAGGYSTLAVRTNGTLWAWGRNNFGQLGMNDVVNRSSPVQVGALTNWGNSVIETTENFSAALKTDGTIWSWGYNGNGELGLGDTISRSSPVQIGALTTWSNISIGELHVVAVKTDGTIWSWGYNASGELGLGDTISRSSPVQIGALTTWSKVMCGYQYTVARQTDGTIWFWGLNSNGQSGLGDTVNRSSPVQIGALTSWSLPDKFSGGEGPGGRR